MDGPPRAALTAPRLSNPWWIVFGSGLALMVGAGPVSTYTYGLFIQPLESEFGWNRAMVAGAHSAAVLTSALAVPFIGLLMDRIGVRRVLIPVLFLFAVSLAALSLTTSLAMLIVIKALVGLTGAGHGPLPYVKSIAAAFDQRRGVALGIAMAGIGLGAALVPQYASFIIDSFGWRIGFASLGALVLVIALPAVVLFVREPGDRDTAAEGVPSRSAAKKSPADLPGVVVGVALRSRAFWTIAISILLVAAAVNGMLLHAVPLLTDMDFTRTEAARMMAVAGLSTFAGRLICGFVLDRMFAPWVAAFSFAIGILGLFLLRRPELVVPGVACLGLAAGAEIDLLGYMTSRYFGLRAFGQLYGVVLAAFTLGAAVGPLAIGALYVQFNSYGPALLAASGLLLVAGGFILTLGPYAYPVQKKDAQKAS